MEELKSMKAKVGRTTTASGGATEDGARRLWRPRAWMLMRNHGAVSLPVRVNLPSELGGGFTLVMCFLRGGQTVRDFITRLIGMMQTTTAAVLLPESYGLTPRGASDGERDEEGRDASGAPPVFLKPDSLLADAFQEEAELELDLRRLRPLTQAQAAEVAATAQAATEDAAAATESTPSGSSSRGLPSFAVPPLPTPPAHSVLHHTCLSKLKRLRPPADAPPEVLVVSTLVPPCALPAHLAESLPHDMRTVALASALQARESSAAALAAASSSAAVAAASSSVAASVPSESDSSALRKERARLARKLDEYAAHVFDRLLARGIGEDPHITLQMAAAVVHPRSQQGERLGTGAHAAPSTMWGGWDAVVIKPPDAHVHEVPLLFVSTKKMPTPLPKKFDVTTDCLVVTNRRIVQVEDGAITNTLPFGADSGLILRLPKETDDGEEGRCPIHVLVRDAAEGAREAEAARARAQAEAEAESEEDEDEEGDGRSDKNGASDDSPRISRRARRRSMEEQRRLPSRRVTFYVPNPDIAGFLEEYLMYAQEKSSLEAHLGLLEQARLDRIAHYRTDRCLRGWTYLLKGIAGPLLFGPLRQPVYETAIKQVLAQVQQMDLKTVKLTSLRLAEFALPTLDSSPAALHANGDQLPSLRLVDYAGHPHHTYVFDLHWSAPSFYIKVEISGKKLVSFQLAVEMRGVEVRGTLRLRSSPYEPEKAAVSFVSLPHLSFGVGSHVVVGSVKLPFQRAIEKIIYQHIQAAIEGALRDKIVGDRWQSIYVEKNGLTTQLDRWWGVSRYPFKYDGTDDESMMSYALVVTTQAEATLRETVREMKHNRERMSQHLGRGTPGGSAGSSRGSSRAHSRKSSRADLHPTNGDEETAAEEAEPVESQANHDSPPPSASSSRSRKKPSSSRVRESPLREVEEEEDRDDAEEEEESESREEQRASRNSSRASSRAASHPPTPQEERSVTGRRSLNGSAAPSGASTPTKSHKK